MFPKQSYLVLVASLVCEWMSTASAHGRLWEPPSRSTMWRRGWNTPPNYNDMELFCGGFDHQVSLGYKCGLCGDPYDGVRENETGGKYATGKITQTYRQGQKATLEVDLTAAHKGYFEFKVCARNDPRVRETQECLNQHPLPLADGSGYKYYPQGSSMIQIEVTLPESLVCDYCVLQWRYHTGNSWGVGPEGGCVGCGPQEEFYGCADFRIVPANTTEPIPTSDNQQPTVPPFANTAGAAPPAPTNCKAKLGRTSLNRWCLDNCQKGYCPKSLCTCPVAGLPSPRICRAPASAPQNQDLCTVKCTSGECPYYNCECF
ncbi:hypothetical protein BsWGS_25842 [Bradybaena similaris]